MSSPVLGPLVLHHRSERWVLKAPFTITGLTRHSIDVLVVTIEQNGRRGEGEAVGVHYMGETVVSMRQQIEAARSQIEAGVSRDQLRNVLRPGGARNAVDAALWDLEAKLTGRAAWIIAGTSPLAPLETAITCGADDPLRMAQAAIDHADAKIIKLKLTGEATDPERVRAVRRARSDVELTIDANQGLSIDSFRSLLPVLIEADVKLIEQPFPRGQDHLLDQLSCPLPVAADESAQDLRDLPGLIGRYAVVNIKLDKCGGLTEALMMAQSARELGLRTWVGNTMGTSLAMAPAFVLGQVCDHVELDGPIFLATDRPHPVQYQHGRVFCPESLWGSEHTLTGAGA